MATKTEDGADASAEDTAAAEAQVAAAAKAAEEAAAEAAKASAQPAGDGKLPWLTTRPSDEYGPQGHFVDLTSADAAPYLDTETPGAEPGDPPVVVKGLLVAPTADQLAQRLKL